MKGNGCWILPLPCFSPSQTRGHSLPGDGRRLNVTGTVDADIFRSVPELSFGYTQSFCFKAEHGSDSSLSPSFTIWISRKHFHILLSTVFWRDMIPILVTYEILSMLATITMIDKLPCHSAIWDFTALVLLRRGTLFSLLPSPFGALSSQCYLER